MSFDPAVVHRVRQGSGHKSGIFCQPCGRDSGEPQCHRIGMLRLDGLDSRRVGEVRELFIGQARVAPDLLQHFGIADVAALREISDQQTIMNFSRLGWPDVLGGLGNDMGRNAVGGRGVLARPGPEIAGVLFLGRALPATRIFPKAFRVTFAPRLGSQQVGMPVDLNTVAELSFQSPHTNRKIVAPRA